ncbi:hypothetical protein MBANPS3_008309 [Mucor bainieri]
MVSKELFEKTLDNCAVEATSILYALKGDSFLDNINDKYRKLEASKRPLYGDSLFKHTESLLKELDKDVLLSEDDMAKIEQSVSKIDLALFAYHIFQKTEYEACVNAFFQRAVSPFNKYTKNEIQLFLSLRLYLLRQQMNMSPNANTINQINEHFSKDSEFYFHDDDSSEKEAGRRQIMMAVDIVSEFLCSRTEDLNDSIRFGAPPVVEKFLRDFITYRLDHTFSCKPDREIEEGFPETKDAMKDLVDQLFDPAFIDNIVQTQSSYDDNTDEYALENSDAEGDDSVPDDNESSSHNSSSRENSPFSEDEDNADIQTDFSVKEDAEEYNPPNEEVVDETDEMQDDDDDDEGEDIIVSTSRTRSNPPRHRITDEQPGARPVTAEEADFLDDADVGPSRRFSAASTSNTAASGSRRRQLPSLSNPQPQKRRRTSDSTYHTSSESNGNADNTSVNEDDELEQEATPTHTPTPPRPPPNAPVNYLCEDGIVRKVVPVPRICNKPQRWTADEVAALEEGLRVCKNRAWTRIRKMMKDRLRLHNGPQLKDKSKNEVKRRRKLGLPLGGFEYYLNPIEDHVVKGSEGLNSEGPNSEELNSEE